MSEINETPKGIDREKERKKRRSTTKMCCCLLPKKLFKKIFMHIFYTYMFKTIQTLTNKKRKKTNDVCYII